MPDKNFVERWVDYASERTEAPPVFHKYMAYMAVATTLGNRAWMGWNDGKLFPNLYILFLSESASYKSTAINMIRNVISLVDEEIETPSDCTSASLANVFKKYKQGFLPVDEFSTILRAEDGHFSTVKTMLTSIYNCPKRYRLPYRMQEDEADKQFIEYPVFSIVAATTPHTFMKDADIEDMKGGFLSRFITVPGKKTGRSIPIPPDEDMEAICGFSESLKNLRNPQFWNPSIPIKFKVEARHLMAGWYDTIKDKMDTDPAYMEMANAVNRVRTYAIKFAMLHSIIEGRTGEDDHMILEPDILEGIKIANSAIESMFASMLDLETLSSDSVSVKNLAKAEKYLSQNAVAGPVMKTDLYKIMKRTTKHEMDQIIATLKDSGRIKTEASPNGSFWITWKR